MSLGPDERIAVANERVADATDRIAVANERVADKANVYQPEMIRRDALAYAIAFHQHWAFKVENEDRILDIADKFRKYIEDDISWRYE